MTRQVSGNVAEQSSHNALYRKIEVNYNQVEKMLYIHFSQKKALAMLYKLENETRNLIAVSEKIFATVQKLRQNDSQHNYRKECVWHSELQSVESQQGKGFRIVDKTDI